MGYYQEEPPPHGHRNPSELAENELLSSFHGNFCGMPATADEIGPSGIEFSGRVEAPLIAPAEPVQPSPGKLPSAFLKLFHR